MSADQHVRIVGLTGGIASGKSTVSRMFAENGTEVIDADAITREVVRKSTPAWDEIVAHFGRTLLNPDGEIDRVRLGAIVFQNPGERHALEAIVHPRVHEETERRIHQIGGRTPGALVILDIPLLFETNHYTCREETIVVYVPEKVQLARLMARDGISRESAMDRIRSQLPIEEKKKRGTYLIDNSGNLSDTRRQVMALAALLKTKKTD